MIIDLTSFQTGFCDRLRQVTFCAAVAGLKGHRELYIKEEITPACPFRFIDLCTLEGFNLHTWTEKCAETSLRFDHSLFPPNLSQSRRYKPADISLSAREFRDRWFASYALLRPLPHLAETLENLKVGPRCLGFHLRFTDKIRQVPRPFHEITPQQLPRLQSLAFHLLKDRLDRLGLDTVYLACDDGRVKEEWIERITGAGYQVISQNSHYNLGALRQTSGEDFVVDLFALARCQRRLGTLCSGVVWTADWMNGIYTTEFVSRKMLGPALVNLLRKISHKLFGSSSATY